MLTFAPLTLCELEWARGLHNDISVLSMLTDPHVVSQEEQLIWFTNLQQSKTSQRIVAMWMGHPIGLFRLDHIDYYNKSACVGLDIHHEYRGQGFAKQIYRHFFKQLFVGENFHRLWLLVASYNRVARNLYLDLGFHVEGAQRDGLLKDGRFYDYIMMSMLQSQYYLQQEQGEIDDSSL